jgi:protein-L-isoaspartate(D-aspartate) O-methyltransferase
MGEVPRERFVPDERCAAAYADLIVPLGHGRELNSPMALGRMLSEAGLRGNERALVVGAATGYSAAVLHLLAGDVTALEEQPELAAVARDRLSGTGVQVVEGPLHEGYGPAAPYDFILIDGAVEQVPQAIVDQVADGGQVALALSESGISRLCIGRVVAGAFGTTAYSDAAAARLPGFEKVRTFSF